MIHDITLQSTALIFLMLFFAITFGQSAVDKIIDRKGNLEFITSHFKNSPLRGQVGPLLGTLTAVELAAAATSVYGALRLMVRPSYEPVFYALCLCASALLMLLVGQRLAKDYAGAATLAGYFVLVMAGFLLLKA